jgi:hypothetical protein
VISRLPALVLAVSSAIMVPLSSAQESRLCDTHPTVARADVRRADKERKGIVSTRRALADENREGSGPLAIFFANPGGDACENLPRPMANAAAAVGALRYYERPHCSAVLVSDGSVVTAAHCVKGFDLAAMDFAIGPDPENPLQVVPVLSGPWHKDYDPERAGVHDIAVLHLKGLVTEVEAAELASQEVGMPQAENLLHVGHGIAGVVPGGRRCVSIPVHDVCGQTFSNKTNQMNTCSGDSGGGVFRHEGARWVLSGVTSWGDEACAEYGVSTDVGHRATRDWIVATISDFEKANRERLPAAIPEAAKTFSPDSAARTFAALEAVPAWQRSEVFEWRYGGKWVRWRGVAMGLPRPAGPGTCDIYAEVEGRRALLTAVSDGCRLVFRAFSFAGRLSAFQGEFVTIDRVEIAAVEEVVAMVATQPEPLREREAWSDVAVASAGGASEQTARTVVLSLVVPPEAEDLSFQTHHQWCDQNLPWGDATQLPVGQDGDWSRFVDLRTESIQAGTRVTVLYRNWSHNRNRCARLRATFRSP